MRAPNRSGICLPTWNFLLTVALLAVSTARAEVQFNVLFVDPSRAFAGYQSVIRSHIQSAGADWARYLKTPTGKTPSIEVRVVFETNRLHATAGGSAAVEFVAARNGFDVYETGMAAEIRTGTDPNGADADVDMFIDTDFLINHAWFDPDPTKRIDTVPSNRVDAYSVFLHELGHALFANGWRDWKTGALPLPGGTDGAYLSTFDENITVEPDGKFFFTGPATTARYGTRLPLAFFSIYHLGNPAPSLGSDLLYDLMCFSAKDGQRAFISTIDLALLQDSGLALAQTEIVPPKVRVLEPTPSGQLTIRWTGANYGLVLETSISLANPDWKEVASGLNGTEHTFKPPDGKTGFFRLIAK